jgi:hypothetical protein
MVKQSHNTCMEAQGEDIYSSYSFTTSALEGGEWSASCPGRTLPLGKKALVPTVEAGWAPEPVWTQRLEEKSFRLCRGSNLDHLVIQSARYYTDWATLAPIGPIIYLLYIYIYNIFMLQFSGHCGTTKKVKPILPLPVHTRTHQLLSDKAALRVYSIHLLLVQ